MLGPWAYSNLYNLFAPKVAEFAKLKNLKDHKDFILFITCVI